MLWRFATLRHAPRGVPLGRDTPGIPSSSALRCTHLNDANRHGTSAPRNWQLPLKVHMVSETRHACVTSQLSADGTFSAERAWLNVTCRAPRPAVTSTS